MARDLFPTVSLMECVKSYTSNADKSSFVFSIFAFSSQVFYVTILFFHLNKRLPFKIYSYTKENL